MRTHNKLPGVEVLLDIDHEYREKARAGSLRRIAPRRMNPEGNAWLPVLHKRVGPWHFTALFSNTERAHELHRVYDWVVIYFEDGQYTVACAWCAAASRNARATTAAR